jgi:RNA polymerase sigma-70 factor (ECF subfamily)
MVHDGVQHDPDGEYADDGRLAADAAAGDHEAQHRLVLRLQLRVRNVAHYVVRNEADAEDVAQSAMLEILRCIESYRSKGPLAGWATGVAIRTAVAFLRSRQREDRNVAAVRDATQGLPMDGAGSPPVLRAHLARGLARLSQAQRLVVVLHLVFGLTLDEIAGQTGAPVNTVKDRLRVGRQELRRAILDDPLLRDALKKGRP